MKVKFIRKHGSGDNKLRRTIKVRLTRVSEQVRKEEIAAEPAPALKRLPPTAPKNLTLNKLSEAKVSGRPTDVVVSPEAAEKEKRKWKARAFSGRHLPVLQCNNCSLSRVCSKFRAGYECAFLPFLQSHRVESVTDLTKYMKEMVGNSMRRAQLMNIIETANGGMPSLETSEAMDMAFRQLKDLHGVLSDGTEDSLEIEGDESTIGAIFGGMKLQRIYEETAQMHKADPVLSLPHVPGTEAPTGLPQGDNIAADLLKDAILNQGHSGSATKKDLRSLPDVSIEVSEVTTKTRP